MNVTDFTDDYNDTLTTIITDNYNKLFLPKCLITEHNIDKFIPTILLTIPCGLSFLCLMSLRVYTLIKPLITFK